MRLPSVEEPKLGVGPAVGARVDTIGERPQCLVSLYAAAALAGHVASADVHVHGGGLPVEAVLDQPVWCGRLGCQAALALGLAFFFCCDPLPGAPEVLLLDAFEEAQHVELAGGSVVHVFDSRL